MAASDRYVERFGSESDPQPTPSGQDPVAKARRHGRIGVEHDVACQNFTYIRRRLLDAKRGSGRQAEVRDTDARRVATTLDHRNLSSFMFAPPAIHGGTLGTHKKRRKLNKLYRKNRFL